MITIEFKSDKVRIGERIAGRVVWNHSGGKHPRKIEVTCRWRVEGRRAKEKSEVDSVVENNTESRSQVVIDFDFHVPPEGPLTYAGKLFAFVWEIVATADMPWAIDETAAKVFTVAPAVWTNDEYMKWLETEADDYDDDDDDDDDVTEPSTETDREVS
jgi:hypothetical protein